MRIQSNFLSTMTVLQIVFLGSWNVGHLEFLCLPTLSTTRSGSNFSVSVDFNCRSALCKTFFGKNNINPKDNKKTEIVKHEIKYAGLEVRTNS